MDNTFYFNFCLLSKIHTALKLILLKYYNEIFDKCCTHFRKETRTKINKNVFTKILCPKIVLAMLAS